MWLGFNTAGYDLARGIDILVDSLKTSTDALAARHAQTAKDYAAYETGVADGSIKRIGEYEEGIGWIWEQSEHYDYDLETIAEVLATMNKAHVVALYHHWERVILRWAKIQKPKKKGNVNHEDLCGAIEAAGFKVHPRMAAIRDLNNALKHNSAKYGPDLLVSWPELFDDDFDPGGGQNVNWHDAISITVVQMDEIVEALRSSGPPTYLPKPVDWID
jgi:hypothetical protein